MRLNREMDTFAGLALNVIVYILSSVKTDFEFCGLHLCVHGNDVIVGNDLAGIAVEAAHGAKLRAVVMIVYKRAAIIAIVLEGAARLQAMQELIEMGVC